MRTARPEAPPAVRYRFTGVPSAAFAPMTRLEEVWASSRYMRFTDFRVTYAGAGPHVLTEQEQAIVDVVAAAGGDVSNPQATYLQVLRASTRIHPARFVPMLGQFGRPIIVGSLALAPDSPQAGLMENWLAASA
jgi:hypothetical protein